MGIIVNNTSSYTPPPAGSHIAVCIGYVDLGTQQSVYEGKQKSAKKVRVLWELCEHRKADGLPIVVGRSYSLSFDPKASLRLQLESWRGRPFTELELKGFDLDNIVGKHCMINIIHEPKVGGGVGDKITAITPLHPSMAKPVQVSPRLIYVIEQHTDAVFDSLPMYLQNWILKSPEGVKARSGKPLQDDAQGEATNEDREGIPF